MNVGGLWILMVQDWMEGRREVNAFSGSSLFLVNLVVSASAEQSGNRRYAYVQNEYIGWKRGLRGGRETENLEA